MAYRLGGGRAQRPQGVEFSHNRLGRCLKFTPRTYALFVQNQRIVLGGIRRSREQP